MVLSLWDYKKITNIKKEIPKSLFNTVPIPAYTKSHHIPKNTIILGDCISQLRKIKSNSIATIFADPPYNISKKYDSFNDEMNMDDYFKWCDKWLYELARILKKGGSLFILNLPVSAMNHFVFLHKILYFQNWIVWDALSTPLKKIMPAHYTILYFTKGKTPNSLHMSYSEKNGVYPHSLNYNFCIRPGCINKRNQNGIIDEKPLSDLWSDIHRVKHNSLREDHPTLLPPKLLQRIITMSSNNNDVILDCFNGVGTTTLMAEKLNRRYIGIEKSSQYSAITKKRHRKLKGGADPFQKRKSIPTVKNSELERVRVRKYRVPKKILQLEVKAISKKIKKIPQRSDVIKHSKYPIKYFDDYFKSWSEVTEAAKTTGMSEKRTTRRYN